MLSARRILAELDRLPHPLDEHADPVHVTASAIVVGTRGVILHRHKRLGMWLQPGGHVDAGETLAVAALREAREETGLAVHHPPEGAQLVHVDVHEGGRGHLHLDVRYLMEADGSNPRPSAGESQQVRWFGWDEAIALADPGLEGGLRRLRPLRCEEAGR
ncbi:MAG: NUDIX domain-containing protein [Nitriliruptorales bacterium]|nr:NUDIX domain-containing protein [Nitriliruptorales bacterium]